MPANTLDAWTQLPASLRINQVDAQIAGGVAFSDAYVHRPMDFKAVTEFCLPPPEGLQVETFPFCK